MFHCLGSFSATVTVLQSVLAFSGATLAVPTTSSIATTSDCNTGSILCCDAFTTVDDPAVTRLADRLGIPVPPSANLIGLNCSSVSAIGIGENSCSAELFCCKNSFNGGVALGCAPVDVS
ncbi:hypothetical protein VKT23_018767 [Stygiomarasmius scandens]|uniref:Hydrophobin n=1 Tax=Marasmiellus scandens TaxID=2682957 RepID=A0ABR1INB9_9AGAR